MGIEIYDEIVDIKQINSVFRSSGLPMPEWCHRTYRINYEGSMIHDSAAALSLNYAPDYSCFYDVHLIRLPHDYVYPGDYELLAEFFD